MRLLKYIEQSPLPKEVNLFRAMSIGITNKPKNYNTIINIIKESNTDINKVDIILKKINIELKSIYKGDLKLALCLDESIQLKKIKIKEKYMDKLKEILYTSNAELAKIKEKLEESF